MDAPASVGAIGLSISGLRSGSRYDAAALNREKMEDQEQQMAKRAFISFDYDNDAALKTLLIGQAKNRDSPFEIADWSIKDPSPNWRAEARRRIRACDVVIVLCGEHTHTATGVAAEVSITQEEEILYFLLAGYADRTCRKPGTARPSDKVYKWTWDNLKALIGGAR